MLASSPGGAAVAEASRLSHCKTPMPAIAPSTVRGTISSRLVDARVTLALDITTAKATMAVQAGNFAWPAGRLPRTGPLRQRQWI